MQTTTDRFDQLATGNVRPISWGVTASFDKSFDDSVTFFTLDTSVLDGPDILRPSDDNPLQEWDKYSYAPYADRAVSIEVTREEVEPYSIAQAYADISFNNYDGYFTPGSMSPIGSNILPGRPFRALLGFDGELVPQIVGLSVGMPHIDKASRLASFHIIDFMSFLMEKDVSETIMLQDVYTHEVLDHLLQLMGLLSSQYSLDTSINKISFFYVEKGDKFGTIVAKLMEAEMGRLYMDEAGVIRFRNRYNYSVTPVYEFGKHNVIDYQEIEQALIINNVKVAFDKREVQLQQSIWTNGISGTVTLVPAGQSVVVWAQFLDPVTTAIDPIYSAAETNTSYFTSTLNDDGTGAYTDVNATMELFSKAAKITFNNTGASNTYIVAAEIYGTPVKVVDTVTVEEKDQDSIDSLGEQRPFEVTNEYIQTESNAQSIAIVLLHDFSTYGASLDIDVKGSPAIQLGDAVLVDLDEYQGIHITHKTTNILQDGKFIQRLRVMRKTIPTFFTLDVSVLDGIDVLNV